MKEIGWWENLQNRNYAQPFKKVWKVQTKRNNMRGRSKQGWDIILRIIWENTGKTWWKQTSSNKKLQ